MNEPGHLVAGLSHWRFGDFSLFRVNPPLVRMVATLPVVLSGYQLDFPDLARQKDWRPEVPLGEDFFRDNGRRSLWLMTLARWTCIPFSWLGLLVCYLWAKDLYGVAAGLLASALWCFSPMVLGHASLITPDAHAASLGLLACYTFWRWLKSPTWHNAAFTGLVLGLAELSKTTLILLFPLWPVLWIVYRLVECDEMTWTRWRDEALMLALRMLIALNVINMGYLGNGSFMPLGDYTFASELLSGQSSADIAHKPGLVRNRFHGSMLAYVPVPLPYDYVRGIDMQQLDFEHFGTPSYLRGVFQERGWWYYYAYAALVKTPLGTWGLLLLTVGLRLTGRGPRIAWCDEFVLLAPAVVIFAIVSSKTGFSHHYRYIFPCIPFVLVWISQVGVVFSSRVVSFYKKSQDGGIIGESHYGKFLKGLIAICIAASIGSSLWQYPHSLAYFNEAAGGPQRGPEHLLNSNIDWGQDLLHLESWIKTQAVDKTVFVAFADSFNPFDLEIAQIAPWPLKGLAEAPASIRPIIPDGRYAICVNQLYELPWPLYERNGTRYYLDKRPLESLRGMQPIDRVGHSIRIYSAEQLRTAYLSVDVAEHE